MKRILFLSDIHAGHRWALTHERYHLGKSKDYEPSPLNSEILRFQKESWKWFTQTVAKLGKIDYCIVNGDAIDGNGSKNGGIELLTTDRTIQADMAKDIVLHTQSSKYIFTYGTPYHGGANESFEKGIADALDSEIVEALDVKIEGLNFNIRHHVSGGGSLPCNLNTAPIKEVMFELMDEAVGNVDESCDILVRSHRHRYTDCSTPKRGGRAVVTPCLQFDSSYGATKMSGMKTDFGVLVMEVEDGEVLRFEPIFMDTKKLRKGYREI